MGGVDWTEVATLILDKVAFKVKNTKQNRKQTYNKGRLNEKDIIGINLYPPNNIVAKQTYETKMSRNAEKMW